MGACLIPLGIFKMMRGMVLAIIVIFGAVGMQAEGFAAYSEQQHHQELFEDLMDAPNTKEYVDHFAANFFAPDSEARAEMAAAESANADYHSLLGTTLKAAKKGAKKGKKKAGVTAVVKAMAKAKAVSTKKGKKVAKVVKKKVAKVAKKGKKMIFRKGKLHGKAHRTRVPETQEEKDRRAIAKRGAENDSMRSAQITERMDEGDVDDLEITRKAKKAVRHMFLESKDKCKALRGTVYTKCAQIFCNKGKAKLCLSKYNIKTCKAEAKERVFKEKDQKAQVTMARLHSLKLEKKHKKAREVGVKAKAKERKTKAADAASERWIKKTVRQTSHSSATAAIDNNGGDELMQDVHGKPVGSILKHLRTAFRKGKRAKKKAAAAAKRRLKLLSSKKCKHGRNAAYHECSAITSDTFKTCRKLALTADSKFRSVLMFMKKNRKTMGRVDVDHMSDTAKGKLTAAILHRLAKEALKSKLAKKALFKYKSDKAHLKLAVHNQKKAMADASDKNKAAAVTKVIAKAKGKKAGKVKGKKAKVVAAKKAAVAKKIAKDAKGVAKSANAVVAAKYKKVKKFAHETTKAGHALKDAAKKDLKDVKKGASKAVSLYEMEAELFDRSLDKPVVDLYDQEEDLFQEQTHQDDVRDSRKLSLYDEEAADFDSMLH